MVHGEIAFYSGAQVKYEFLFLGGNHAMRRTCFVQNNSKISLKFCILIQSNSLTTFSLLFCTPTWPPWRQVQTKNLIISEIVTVTSAYNAVTAEQLSLSPGQLILVKRKYPDGWWEGELQVSANVNGFLLCCERGFFSRVLLLSALAPSPSLPLKKIRVYFRFTYGELVCFAVDSSICIALDSRYKWDFVCCS